MSKEVSAFVKVRNDETGTRRKERLCYLETSPYYLNFKDEYFYQFVKTLQTLERHLSGKDVVYELEIVSENEIAVESFNRRLKGEPLPPFYRYDNACILDFLEYLKEKANNTCLVNLIENFQQALNRYSKGIDEYYALVRYVNEVVEESNNKKTKKR